MSHKLYTFFLCNHLPGDIGGWLLRAVIVVTLNKVTLKSHIEISFLESGNKVNRSIGGSSRGVRPVAWILHREPRRQLKPWLLLLKRQSSQQPDLQTPSDLRWVHFTWGSWSANQTASKSIKNDRLTGYLDSYPKLLCGHWAQIQNIQQTFPLSRNLGLGYQPTLSRQRRAINSPVSCVSTAWAGSWQQLRWKAVFPPRGWLCHI